MTSSFDQYLYTGAPSLQDVLPLLVRNTFVRQRFRIVLTTGESKVGVPTLNAFGATSLVFHAGAGDCFEIPLVDISSAVPLDRAHEDRAYIRLAIEEAKKTKFEDETPRPFVGALVVKDDLEVGRSHRGRAGEGVHAEHGLLDVELSTIDLTGATLYSTLEPCTARRGKAEIECVQRIIARKIGRVVIGTLDPNQTIKGEGVWRLREAGIRVSLCEHDQMATLEDLNRVFFGKFRRKHGSAPDARSFLERLGSVFAGR